MSRPSNVSGGPMAGKEKVLSHAKKLVGSGQHEAALIVFDEVIACFKPSPDDGTWGHVAACYRRLSMNNELRSLKERLTEAGRPHVQVILQLALAYAMKDGVDKSVESLDEALGDYGPDQQADILRIKARVLSDAGRHEEAIKSAVAIFGIGTSAADRLGRIALAFAERKRDRAALSMSSSAAKLKAYWNERRHAVYIHVCSQLIKIMGRSAEVVADIGSNRTPILDFYPGTPMKYSVDPGSPYENNDVVAVREDFFDWEPSRPVQLASCLQVMEHVPEVSAFARRLLGICEVALISVPYMEEPGLNKNHIHTEIDLDRITEWFGRPPNYHFIARELSGGERIICVFDTNTFSRWPTLCEHCIYGLAFRYRWSLEGSSVRQKSD